ncbi:MAG: tetratricopeptide repeat protein [Fimbriimonadaceae bacterium]|nr:tetratricopeptide repeat protein [Fimbriimonadaceae bacterium]
MNRYRFRFAAKLTLLGALVLISGQALAFTPRGQGESWDKYSQRLRGLANTYQKWGITLKVEPKAFTSTAGPLPSYLKVVSGFESGDTLNVNIETGLGKNESTAVAIAGEFKYGPDGKKVSGNGVIYLKGTGVGGKFKYDNVKGLQLETGLEETFYSIGINIGNDEKGPVGIGLKLGPAKIEIDLVKWGKRCKEVAPYASKVAAEKVGGVMVRADVPDLAAAIAKAPEPNADRLTSFAVVSIKKLARGEQLNRLTDIHGVAVDKVSRDVLLIGSIVSGHTPIDPDNLIALCASIGKLGTTPYVSIDPDPFDFTQPHRGRIGGLPDSFQDTLLSLRLLEIDYALKGVIMGHLRTQGVKSLPDLLSEAVGPVGGFAARFWFVPKELFPADIEVERGDGLSIYWFAAEPVVRTEPMSIGGTGASSGPGRGMMESLASNVTRHLARIQEEHPEIQLNKLRQIFGLATALAILKQDPSQDIVQEVVDNIAPLSVQHYDFKRTFTPIGQRIVKDGGMREVNVWGGIFSSATLYGQAGSAKVVSAARAKGVRSAAGSKTGKISSGGPAAFVNGDKIANGEIISGRYGTIAFLLSKKDYKGAAAEVERILKRNPTASDVLLLKMRATLYQEDWKTMLTDAQRYVKAKPKDARGYYWQGVAQGSLGYLKEARASADKGIQLAPKSPESYLLRSNLRLDTDPEGAVADATKGVQYSPESAFAYSIRGQAYASMRRFAEAIDDYEKSVSMNPMVANYWQYLGLYRMQLDRTAGAVDAFTYAIGLDPYDPYTYFARGDVLLKQGNYATALEDFRRSMALDPLLRERVQPKIDECLRKIG